ncbi:MAG: ATP-dependent DNA helicase UvrD2 [Candidatus Ordinivivax streblomastigis]|uniref:ATP-dependent DNA helicase UvrD2 n=1 Tax=Candidatus Ordinivivax streblomastigis TaxID=2540710 RepID=A0A5M8P3J0_9BACT|nr:MAG: ATP-dependent DNA helicase UvrD2 [Candidatus Ordinivivax streblomastigis]
MQTNQQLELATNYVRYTGQNIFLTGKAGTGKTTFLHHLRETLSKRVVVVAPTGVAAINAHGVTIHSFFQLPFGLMVDVDRLKSDQMRLSREKTNIIRSLDLLVIDEISMVRADLLDAVDAVLRRFRTHSKPFGGVQLLMIGDLQQLAPVVKDDERELLSRYYDTPYFFSSKALRETSFVSIELTHVFRQQDEHFISILNKVRENNLDASALEALNKRYIPDFQPKEGDGYITLCTHNAQAQRLNDSKLSALRGKEFRFKATVEGTFPEYSYPTDFELVLKEQAQVMFVKNDSSAEKLFYNGKIGKITHIDAKEIVVRCPDDDEEITVQPMKWSNVRFSLNEATNEIEEVEEGSFIQYPLKLAWAITIHKSQGLTFERAVIDAQSSFAHGQVYVALSRCKTLEGMVLSTPIHNRSIINDRTVSGFTQQIEQNQPDENQLNSARIAYQNELLMELFRFGTFRNRILYIEKIIHENVGSIPIFTQNLLQKMFPPVQQDIIEVADKFQAQINRLLPQQPDVEQNTALQERIGPAAVYFSAKTQTLLLDVLSKADLDIDNKAVKKQLNDAVNRLEEDARIKYESLKACSSGFRLMDLLQAKAIASIEKAKPKEARKFSALENEEIVHPILFNRLRTWRTVKSVEMNVPAYGVFSQKALYELVNYLPVEGKTLAQINGIGPKKLQQFGAEIIEIIQEYCNEQKIEGKIVG